ncbi:hypothetical protein DFS34DRAFT_689184 [Phlyctochytrium arcticum]|nr:hypothetical protein DFS34DRAFT_689184 [Phlyctochytrium arcticum]
MTEIKQVEYQGITWYKNITKNGGAQNHVLQHLETDKLPVWNWSSKNGRMWGAATDDQVMKLIAKNRNIFEVLLKDRPRKVYFDIDKTQDSLEYICKTLNGYFPNAQLNISGRSEPDLSIHIVISNYVCLDEESTNLLSRIAAVHGWDTSVYNKNSNFKAVNQSKPAKDAPIQRILQGSNYVKEHLVQRFIAPDVIDIMTLDWRELAYKQLQIPRKGKKNKVTDKVTKKQLVKLDLLSIKQQKLSVPESFEYLDATPLDKLNILPNPQRGDEYQLNHDCIYHVMRWCKHVGISFEAFWKWNKQKDDSASRLRAYQDAWENTNFGCSVSLMDQVLKRFYPKITISRSTQILKKRFDILKQVTGNAFLSADDIHRDKKTTILCASMGQNKTGATIDYLKKQVGKRFLIVSPRITLSANLANRLNAAGLKSTNYRDFSTAKKKAGILDEQDILVCSVQSLHYLRTNFDIVVMDEFDTSMATFAQNCTTHKKRLAANWNMLISQLKHAQKVIILDAFTSQTTVNFVKEIDDNYEVVTTSTKPAQRKFMEYNDFDVWIEDILADLRNGLKLYIFTPAKSGERGVDSIASVIAKELGWQNNKNIISYFAEKEKEKRALIDVEKIWSNPELRVIVTNSVISVGVNFDAKDVFDKVYALYSPIITPRDFFQSITRIRHPKNSTISLFRTKNAPFGIVCDNLNMPECSIFHQLRKDLDIEFTANKNIKNWETFNLFAKMANISYTAKDPDMAQRGALQSMGDLMQDCDMVLHWKHIKDISNEKANHLSDQLLDSNNGDLDTKLQLQKNYYKRDFKHDASNDDMGFIWNSHMQLPSLLRPLTKPYSKRLNHCEEIILEIFNTNDVELGEAFPRQMITKTPLDKINQAFKFRNPVTDYKTNVVGRILNTYFNRDVYSFTQKRTCTRQYGYDTNPDFISLVQLCVANFREHPQVTAARVFEARMLKKRCFKSWLQLCQKK